MSGKSVNAAADDSERETTTTTTTVTVTTGDDVLHDLSGITRPNKPAKLAKQNGVDEDEEENVERCNEEFKSEEENATALYVRRMDSTDSPRETVLTPPERISLNVNVSTKPKLLVRSHAVSGDDDSGVSLRHMRTSRLPASRSTLSSFSFDSAHGYGYTDSTGINLLSFITCTLHKNVKDRNMLLQLEEHMIKLVKDPSRNSQKFPAMSSYNRMLVHRVAAFFGLDHNVDQNGTAVVVNKTSHTRLPDIEFSSLIRNDVYTDEPRRYLKRDVQSYEESRQPFGGNVLFGRRAHSFEVGDCLTLGVDPTANVTVGCAIPANASLHMHLLHQQGSTSSTDASSTHLLESPGSCYSYGDLPVMGVYSPSEGSTTHMFPWSSSESYTSSSVDCPSNLISPVVHNHNRTPLLTRGVSFDTNAPPHRTFGTHSSFPEQRAPSCRRTNSDWHRPEAVLLREASIPENPPPGSVLPTTERTTEVPVSQQQPPPLYTPSAATANDFLLNQYIVNPIPEQTAYTVVQPYLRYAEPPLPIQKLPQQMESLCITGYPEAVPASAQPYLVSPAPAQTIYPQQFLVPSQVGAVYSPQPYFVPIVQRNYVANVPALHGAYPVAAAQYSLSSYDCNTQQENFVDAVQMAKNEPTTYEGSATAAETENLSN